MLDYCLAWTRSQSFALQNLYIFGLKCKAFYKGEVNVIWVGLTGQKQQVLCNSFWGTVKVCKEQARYVIWVGLALYAYYESRSICCSFMGLALSWDDDIQPSGGTVKAKMCPQWSNMAG